MKTRIKHLKNNLTNEERFIVQKKVWYGWKTMTREIGWGVSVDADFKSMDRAKEFETNYLKKFEWVENEAR